MMYLIRNCANGHDSRAQGYAHCWTAHQDELSPPVAIVLSPSWKHTGMMIPFYEKWIEACTAMAAIEAYRRWKAGESQ